MTFTAIVSLIGELEAITGRTGGHKMGDAHTARQAMQCVKGTHSSINRC